ncbi:MAG: hypothetical protein AMS24_05025 [Chlamydiae bacterium SM23_39]|nr:MAG: hypothetical protein AMS24_05025 [Chlamydiae bacterium SM23_39]
MKLIKLNKRKFSFFAINFTYFLDNLGWSIVFPIFAPLFLDVDNLIFSESFSISARTALLGIFLGAFPLAQFLGAPILGEFADKRGRRKAFILSIAFTCLGYLLTAWSVYYKNLYFLFIGRVVTGIFSGNLSICLASIADLSKEKKSKVKHFGYLSVLGGFAFIVGALLGGNFSDSSVSKYFSLDFPLWIAAFLSFLNLLFVIFAFVETSLPNPNVKFNLFESFFHIYRALQIKNLKKLYFIYFLFIFSWTMLFQFSLVLVITKFSFSHLQIGELAAFMGVCWALGSGLISKVLVSKFPDKNILKFSLLFFVIFSTFLVFVNFSYIVIIILGVCGIIGGVTWPLCVEALSNKANINMQGKVLGMSQSVQSLAMAISPIIGGFLANYFIEFSFLAASFASLIGFIIYLKEKL